MAIGRLCFFEHESKEGSCLCLGFSENSITLAVVTLLRNANKDGRVSKGPGCESLGDEAGTGPGAAAQRWRMPRDGPARLPLRARLILRHLLTACEPQGPTDIKQTLCNGICWRGFRNAGVSCWQMSCQPGQS